MSRPLSGARHDWLGFLQPTGLVVAPAVLDRLGLWPEPQGPEDGRALAAAVGAWEGGDTWPLFGEVLGWPAARVAGAPGGPALPDGLVVSLRDGETLLTPSWAVLDGEGVQLLVRMEGLETPLDRRGAADGWEATAQQRFERLLRETGVGAGVLLGWRETGRNEDTLLPDLRLVTAPRGEQSGWIAWPLRSLSEVSGRGMLAGLKLLLDGHAVFTGARSHRLPTMLAESRAAQADVSTRLSGQVLAALHELLRGFDAAAPELVRDLAAREPHRLYEGLLTVLLRLIFILYAEDRQLMPSDRRGTAASLYEQGYALGGLHVRLRDDEALHSDIMDERRGAWGRLLALFRLVERGHDGFMQARGGKLFSEAEYPFLLGRAAPGDRESVLPVSDGCVLRVLDSLLVLDGERLMYRALSVEQIGSVYETVMGFTVQVAGTPSLAIRAGKGNKVPVWVDLEALAGADGADRGKLLKERTGRGSFGVAVTKALRAAASVAELEAALAPVIDARASPRGQAVGAGTPILQPTDERRRTGSHYTPPSLTRPIVEHALEPALARIGPDATPAAVLDLKVCDPAVGSGAFLVEACRQLGARLVRAWERWPAQRPTIPDDEDDLLHAKRLVAQHCLRGVDRNPLALDLAKLSLWLETLASEHEFTFLDHVLRVGDSLVGLPNPKIVAVTWGKVSGQHGFVELIVREGIQAATELNRLMRAEAEIAPYAIQEGRHREAQTALTRAHLVADAILESFFAGSTAKARDAGLAEVQQLVLAPSAESWAKLEEMRLSLRASPIGITSFHWELEFPDVFTRANPGFDAIVGNPPFAGKNTIASGHPLAYPDWLKTLHPGAHGNADLAAHFFRRAFGLLRQGGAFGLIATNTIRQGDTRETGLARIVADGGTIYRAVIRHRWEGEAAVVVSMVFVARGKLGEHRHPGVEPGSGCLDRARRSGTPDQVRGDGGVEASAVLDGKPVSRISAYLVEGELDGSPERLRENGRTVFEGTKVYGSGFLFRDDAPATPANTIAGMYDLLRREPGSAGLVRPFLGGEEVYNDPAHRPFRHVIDMTGLTLLEAEERHPVALDLVRNTVKPYRDTVARDRTRLNWWLFEEARPGLYAAVAGREKVLVTSCAATPHWAITSVKFGGVFANTLAVFALSTHAALTTLQSRVHELWARAFASTLEDRLRYTPSDCFETFPLPPNYADAPTLEAAGQAYHDHRAALMIARNQGMTPTYNRFHDADDTAADIAELRRLHAAMDRAVLAAYGWDDLADSAAPVFLDAENEGDHQYQGRLHWPAPFRDALLARLLRLNKDRARMERML